MIILLIYFMGILITSYAAGKLKVDPDAVVIFVIVWPIVLPYYLLATMSYYMYKLGKKK